MSVLQAVQLVLHHRLVLRTLHHPAEGARAAVLHQSHLSQAKVSFLDRLVTHRVPVRVRVPHHGPDLEQAGAESGENVEDDRVAILLKFFVFLIKFENIDHDPRREVQQPLLGAHVGGQREPTVLFTRETAVHKQTYYKYEYFFGSNR